jgi:guanine nucleotide-binding protein G(i) subunit alpha
MNCPPRALLKLNHPDLQLALSNENYRAVILGLPDSTPENDVLPAEIINAMRNLCRDPGIRNILKDQQLINVLGESSIHYLQSIDRIIKDDYIPTDEDIINRCIKPCSIAEVNFKIGELTYRIICIYRQDGARRKWMHCFEGVKAVAFLVRLDGYDRFIVADGERRVVSLV